MSGTGIAPGWVRSLMRSGSERIAVVAVHGEVRDLSDLSDKTLRECFDR